MADYTLKISEKNAKAIALINYLKTLDFVELTKSKSVDWWDELSEENKASIERGLDDLNNNRVHSDEEVRKIVRERILKAKKR
ncbi:MAG: hypothetical protein RQ875_02810 [Vicingaceae bacterium]|nr:hypothetical protein [Vicingaceae bacterium]